MARINSPGLAKSLVVTGEVCNVKQISVDNSSSTVLYWLMVFNAASLPGNGAVPDFEMAIPVSATRGWDWGTYGGERFSKGCIAAISSTAGTLTLAGSNDGFFQATYS